MINVLIIEKSPVVAFDISEVVQSEFPDVRTTIVETPEAAEALIAGDQPVDICILSSSLPKKRLRALSDLLGRYDVNVVVVSEDEGMAELFGGDALHVYQPFTSAMLSEALRAIGAGAARAPQSGRG